MDEPGWTKAENIIANELHPGSHMWFAALHQARGIIGALRHQGLQIVEVADVPPTVPEFDD